MPDRRDSPASVSNICTDLYKTTYRKLLRLSTAEQFRLQTKPRRVFRPQAKKQLNLVFSGGVYVGENTSQPGSVRVVRRQRTASARTGLHPLRRQSPLDFVDGLKLLRLSTAEQFYQSFTTCMALVSIRAASALESGISGSCGALRIPQAVRFIQACVIFSSAPE